MEKNIFIEKVSEEIASGNVIPFIGAGFSKYAGYPLWKELLLNIVSEASKDNEEFEKKFTDAISKGFDKRIANNELQQAADVIDKQVEKIPTYINSIFDNIRKTDNKVISDIAMWNCNTIITTNYDRLLSDILTENKVKNSKFTYKQLDQILGNKHKDTRVIHIHGNLDDIDSIIFSENHIDEKLISNDLFSTFINDCFLNKKLLFIGYGINDPHINSLIKFISTKLKSKIEHFAILNCDEIDCNRFKSEYSINVLRVDGFEGKQSDFLGCLEKINSSVKVKSEKKKTDLNSVITNNEIVRKENLKIIKKFKHLAGIQNLDISRKALLSLIVQEGLKIIGEDHKTFNIHLVEGVSMIVVAEGGVNSTERHSKKSKPLKQGLIGKVYQDKMNYFYAAFVGDYEDDYDNMNPTTKSELIISLKDENDNIIGVLNIESSKDDGLTEEDREILQVVAEQVAIALENKRKYDLLSNSLGTVKLVYESDSYKPQYNTQHDLNLYLNPLLSKMAKSLRSSHAGIISVKDLKNNVIASVGFDEKTLLKVIDDISASVNKVILEESKYVAQVENNVLYAIDLRREDKLFLYFQVNNSSKITQDETKMISLYANLLEYHIRLWNISQLQHKKSYESNLFKSLYEVANEYHDQDVFLNKASEIICKEFDVDWCFIYVKDALHPYRNYPQSEEDVFVLKSISGLIHKMELEKNSYISGEGLTGSVASTNQYVKSDNVFKDKRNSGKNLTPFIAREFQAISFLGVPIRNPINKKSQYSIENENNVIGIISTGRKPDDKFGDRNFSNDEANLLLRIASIIGKEIQLKSSNNRDFEKYSKLLNETSRKFSMSKSESDVFSLLSELVPKYMEEQNFSIFRLTDKKILRMVAPEKYLEMSPPEFNVGQGLTGKVVETRVPIFTLNFDSGLSNCRNFWRRVISTDDRYFLGVPIFMPNGIDIYGVFTLNGRIPSSFNPVFYEKITTEIVGILCNQITLCLSKTGMIE